MAKPVPSPALPADPRVDEVLSDLAARPSAILAQLAARLAVTGEDPLTALREALAGNQLSLAELVEAADRLREQDAHEVFPLALRPGATACLAKLGDAAGWRQRLERRESPLALGEPFFVWEAAEPELTGVFLPADPPRLVLRWVVTRPWNAKLAGGGFGARRQRAVSFFVVDLASGHASFRLQELPPHAERPLQKELALHRRAAGELIDLTCFEPVELEPVIRKLLRSPRVEVQAWAIWLEGKGRLAGAPGPGLLDLVRWRWKRLYGLTLDCIWYPERPEDERIETKLYASANRIDLRTPLSEERLGALLAEVAGLSTGEVEIALPELRAFAARHPSSEPMARKLDMQLQRGRRRAVSVRELAPKAKRAPESLQILVREYPETFELRYTLRCPDTGQPARRLGRAQRVADPARPPAAFECEHPDGVHTHPTAANMELVVLYLPPQPRWGVLGWLRQRLRQRLDAERADHLIETLGLLLFLVFFVPLVILARWGLGLTEERFGNRPLHILEPLLVYLGLAAGLVAVLGGPLLARTLRLLRGLAVVATIFFSTPLTLALEAAVAGWRWLLRRLGRRRAAGPPAPSTLLA